jgi:exopolysaccharide biosynthesis polyprenyl glycosylphosphotransferase
MELPNSISYTQRAVHRSMVPRLPFAAILPGFDLAALVLAWLVMGQHEAAAAFAVAALIALMATGQQRLGLMPRLSDDLLPIACWLTVSVLLVVPMAAILPIDVNDEALGGLIRFVPIAMALVLAFRAVAYGLIRSARARGLVTERTLIVGVGERGVQIASSLLDHPEYGLTPVGFIDSFNDDGLPLPILGSIEDVEDIITGSGITRMIVAFGGTRETELIRAMRALDPLPIEVHVVPRFFEFGGAAGGRRVEDVWGITLVRLRRSALRGAAWRAKRASDLVLASVLTLLAAPIMLVCALGVRLSSSGPILFRQKRVGQRGELFELLKFRSMRINDDSETQWSASDGELMTGFGKLMRKTGVDELPQLFNVLRGEMSLVGPRPERPHFADRCGIEVNGYEDRHRVPVGITGWAQVHGLRGDSSISQRAAFDNNYIEHWSLWRDLVILARTAVTVVRGEGG